MIVGERAALAVRARMIARATGRADVVVAHAAIALLVGATHGAHRIAVLGDARERGLAHGLAVQTVGTSAAANDLGEHTQQFTAAHHLQELRSAIRAMGLLRDALNRHIR